MNSTIPSECCVAIEAVAGSLLAVLDLTGCRLAACGLLERVLHHLRIFFFCFMFSFYSIWLTWTAFWYFNLWLSFLWEYPVFTVALPSSEAAYVDQRVGHTTMGGRWGGGRRQNFIFDQGIQLRKYFIKLTDTMDTSAEHTFIQQYSNLYQQNIIWRK